MDHPQTEKQHRVLIVDDHALIRESMRNRLEKLGTVEVIGEAINGKMGAHQAILLCPDLVIMDLKMGEHDGISATRTIKREAPQIPVIILSAYANQEWVLEAVKAGAAAYLLKEAPIEELEATIKRTLAGEEPMPASQWRTLIERLADEHLSAISYKKEPSTAFDTIKIAEVIGISEREAEVLQRVALGLTNDDIASELHIGLSTCKKHVSNILNKMQVSDRTQATAHAIAMGLAWPKGLPQGNPMVH